MIFYSASLFTGLRIFLYHVAADLSAERKKGSKKAKILRGLFVAADLSAERKKVCPLPTNPKHQINVSLRGGTTKQSVILGRILFA
jgi:hypothetical protein